MASRQFPAMLVQRVNDWRTKCLKKVRKGAKTMKTKTNLKAGIIAILIG
jgi:hypothetical protein